MALRAGDTLRFQTTGFDAYENEVEVQPTWRVVNDIGEISPTGEFTAMQAQTGHVVEGYAILQPRTPVGLLATGLSRFARLSAGEPVALMDNQS